MNPKYGFQFDTDLERLIYMKHKFFEKGISPNEFRKCQMRDMNDINDIKQEIEERKNRENEVQSLINKMK